MGLKVINAEKDVAYRVADVAEMLKVSTRTVFRWIGSGELCVIRLSAGTVRVMKSDLDKFISYSRSGKS